MDAWGESSCKTGEGCCWEGARLEGAGLALCLLGVAGTAPLVGKFPVSDFPGRVGWHAHAKEAACLRWERTEHKTLRGFRRGPLVHGCAMGQGPLGRQSPRDAVGPGGFGREMNTRPQSCSWPSLSSPRRHGARAGRWASAVGGCARPRTLGLPICWPWGSGSRRRLLVTGSTGASPLAPSLRRTRRGGSVGRRCLSQRCQYLLLVPCPLSRWRRQLLLLSPAGSSSRCQLPPGHLPSSPLCPEAFPSLPAWVPAGALALESRRELELGRGVG